MSKVNHFLSQRLKQATETFSKMAGLAELSSSGSLSSFSGVFRVQPLSEQETTSLKTLLLSFADEQKDVAEDLKHLSHLTSEVKAITNQAAILHGERIKKAQELLKQYRDGAFSAWLVAAYGNRQTPYNFLQYYELYHALSPHLVPKLEEMPRQAIYTLASRDGALAKKEAIIENYQGETKQQLLTLIREHFPLEETDGRAPNLPEQAIFTLKKLNMQLRNRRFKPSEEQREELNRLLLSLQNSLNN